MWITNIYYHFCKRYHLNHNHFVRWIYFQDYQVDLYLRQHWYDSRLQHPKLIDQLDLNDPNLVKRIWKPEVYFPNAKDAEFQYVTVPNVLVRIDPGGRILYMLRSVIIASRLSIYWKRHNIWKILAFSEYINYYISFFQVEIEIFLYDGVVKISSR